MAEQRQRTFSSFFLAVVLVASVCRVCSGEPPSCDSTFLAFRALRPGDVTGQGIGPTGIIYERLTPEVPSEDAVCRLGETCCSSQAEDVFQTSVSKRVHDRVTGLLSEDVLRCYNHSFHAEFANYFDASKGLLLQAMNNAFGVFFQPYQDLFDDFYLYLRQTVTTGNTCDLADEFNKIYFKMYTAAFFGHPLIKTTGPSPSTDAFNQCFYQYFHRENAEVITQHYLAFTRTYNHTMYYLRALRYADLVLEQILDFTLTDQCKNSLMRMSYCAQCAGYDTAYTPCHGLCMNSLRGCLLELSEIKPAFEQFSATLLRMKEGLENSFNPFLQIQQIPPPFLDHINLVVNNIQAIKNDIMLECDESGPRNRRSAPLPSEEEEEGDHVITSRQVYDLPLVHLNASAFCFHDLLSVFTDLPEQLCGEEWVSDRNGGCWTGKDMGSYGRDVVGFDRVSQTSNPEVLICSRASHFSGAVRRLGKITQELDILTGRVQCNRDDEDCFFYQNSRCDFFDFSDLDATLDEDGGVSSAFYSGSGESPGCSDDVMPVTVPTVATTDDVTTAIVMETTHVNVVTGNDSFTPPIPGGSDPTKIIISRGVSVSVCCTSLVVLLAAVLSLLL